MTLYACPNCGCTDVQADAWYEINSNKLLSDEEGPCNQCWCPQCGVMINLPLITVYEPKPFHKPEVCDDPCLHCDGDGAVWGGRSLAECGECAGTGIRRRQPQTLPAARQPRL